MFASRKLSEDRLLAKAITGILQSQGHCVIVGSDQLAVSKVLQLKVFFCKLNIFSFYKHWLYSFRKNGSGAV